MKLVIDIHKKDYQSILNSGQVPYGVVCAIMNGTPLPKGHGDLVDRDAINDRFYDIWKELESYSNKPTYKKLLDRWSMCMDTAQPVIETDGGGEDG